MQLLRRRNLIDTAGAGAVIAAAEQAARERARACTSASPTPPARSSRRGSPVRDLTGSCRAW